MTNTLTWDIKPIALPKINANLLSFVSLILLLTMAFMTTAVIAECCYPEELALQAANRHLAAAYVGLAIAEGIYLAAIFTGNLAAILVAKGGVITAGLIVSACDLSVKAAEADLRRCEQTPHPNTASGGCGSGSCSGG